MSSKGTPPTDIPHLIQRLETALLDKSERQTLQALCRAVVQQLDPNSLYKCAWEAAQLSEFLSDETYIQLLRSFTNCIASGTHDHTSPDPEILRLETAISYNDKQQQYDLIRAISATLDAMVDAGVSGLSREGLHTPLLTTLEGLSNDLELHLAQAASYAAQALRAVPDDDSPGDAIARGFLRSVNVAMMITGGVLSKDPQKLCEAALEVIKAGSDFKQYAWNQVKAHTGKSWYMALRITDVLIRNQALDELEAYVSSVSCRIEKSFLCGIYAQLEGYRQTFPEQRCQHVYDSLPTSDKPRVLAWIKFSTTKSTQVQQTPTDSGKGAGHLRLIGREGKKYEWKFTASLIERRPRYQTDIITSQDLLTMACKSSPEVLRYYAMQALKQHYFGNDLLQIKRLSGDTLPMEQCYINLSVVSGPENKDITLREIFEPREQNGHAEKIRPRQVFIEGQAGVGKTTLCKKMTYDFFYNGLWSDQFDWLFWIPLRNLKEHPSTAFNLKGVFAYQFFSDQVDQHRDLLAEYLWKEVDNPTDRSRVLFVLDGLDEITHYWGDDTVMQRMFRRLLQGPHAVIVTTRPYGTNIAEISKFDFRLRAVGFKLEQIESYVKSAEITPERKTAEQILSFIKSHSGIENVMRIPIQLDALCYTWSDSSQDGNDTFQTMTAVYEAIVVSLLRKDAVKLGRVANHSSVDEMSAAEIHGLMAEEINLLEGLAFQGIYNGLIEFNKSTRSHIHKFLKDNGNAIPQAHNSVLRSLSFLRSSNEGAEEDKQGFHFIHLTYQEYFAACYFVKHWFKGTEIPCIKLQNRNVVDTCGFFPSTILDRQKYSIRYNMIWRYVAGLLHTRSSGKPQPLIKFFEQLDAETQDLLGPTHQRLIGQCLSELPMATLPSEFSIFRAKIERKLSWWLVFECDTRAKSVLTGGLEYPEYMVYRVFKHAPLDRKMHILSGLNERSRNSHGLMQLARLWVTKGHVDGQDLEDVAFKLIARNDWESKRKALDIVHDYILEPMSITEFRLYLDAAAALDLGMGSPPKGFQDKLVEWLQHENAEWVLAVSSFLSFSRLTLPPGTVHTLILWLLHKDPWVKEYRAITMDPQPTVVSRVFDAFLTSLKERSVSSHLLAAAGSSIIRRDPGILSVLNRMSKDNPSGDVQQVIESHPLFEEAMTLLFIRNYVKESLRNQPELPSEMQEFLVNQLDNENTVVKQSAADVLENLSNLSLSSLQSLGDKMKAISDPLVLRSLILCFAHYRNLPQNIIQGLVDVLIGQDTDLAEQAEKALSKAVLPRVTLADLVKTLSLDHRRHYAERILMSQSPLPSDILQEIWRRFHDSAWLIIMSQPVLPPEMIDALVNIVEDEDRAINVRCQAILAIKNQSISHSGVFNAMLTGIGDKSPYINEAAAKTLSKYSDLPSTALDALTNCLRECDYAPTRKWAIEALRKQHSTLPSDAIDGLIKCLDDEYLRGTALMTLWEHSDSVSRARALKIPVSFLCHEDKHVRSWAAEMLGQISSLPPETLIALLDCIDDTYFYVRWRVEEALKNQSTFPPDILHRVTLRFSADNEEKSKTALSLLHKREEFYLWLPKMNWHQFRCFYQTAVSWSFQNTFVVVLKHKSIFIALPDMQKEIPITNMCDRLKLRVYFALAQLLILHGRSQWVTELVKSKEKLIFVVFVLPIIITITAFIWF
ncbi:hypothetical protein TSTA_077880 [Talaromyces stipitatus ATCC 10500]|uniref:NACHT domain-containing protein n=1 Tax=Talaromyces stipitatus (strain ATCC 10500 / CBS 375.48 / QM 6759 / NRRL 1006) TaxID=441959 RepID=B8LWN0_TALSN|nr:uncharacterized protein TSTA_077880 [Talaromyces stipitatus ATCC 10500]EED24427.1 hypothetical protein TSTA_077880 [Talaromyces stipitatus ATCC 10500]